MAEKVIAFARSTLENAQGSLIAGAGVLLIFWSAMGLFGTLEFALNTIWKVSPSRPLSKRFVDTFPILILAPIIIIVSSSFTFLVITKMVEFVDSNGLYFYLKFLIHLIYYSMLILITWGFVLFIYLYIPNTKIPIKACLLPSLFSATLLQLMQWGYIHTQVFLTTYNAIYGSFAAIPLFLLWLSWSWAVFLFGAEVASQKERY